MDLDISVDTISVDTISVDLVIQIIAYLNFDDVITVCTLNRKLYYISTNYKNKWKQIIDNIYSGVYDYQDKLNKMWDKLNIPKHSYNYLIYTQLVNILDPITQLMIYYQQNDFKSLNDKKFNDVERFLALFLLRKPTKMENYLLSLKYIMYPDPKFYINMLNGEKICQDVLNGMLGKFVYGGNIKGVEIIEKEGANIHYDNDRALILAHDLEMMKYLIDRGLNIDPDCLDGLIFASECGNIDMVKYYIELGADVTFFNNASLICASEYGNLDIVKILIENGANIHDRNDEALTRAMQNGHKDVIKYLIEHN